MFFGIWEETWKPGGNLCGVGLGFGDAKVHTENNPSSGSKLELWGGSATCPTTMLPQTCILMFGNGFQLMYLIHLFKKKKELVLWSLQLHSNTRVLKIKSYQIEIPLHHVKWPCVVTAWPLWSGSSQMAISGLSIATVHFLSSLSSSEIWHN